MVKGVFSADVRFEGFTQVDWVRFMSLFTPRKTGGGERDPARPQGGVIAIEREGKLAKLLHTQAGRLRLTECAADWPLGAAALATRHHASFAVVIRSGSLERVMESFARKLQRSDDFLAQMLLFIAAVRDELQRGGIDYHPSRLAGLPIPTVAMLDGTFDAVAPRGQSMVFGLFEAGELWTSIALRRGQGGRIDYVLGPDDLRREMGLLSGDWRRDYRHLRRAVERKLGPVGLGVFSEKTTFRDLSVDPTPGAWARAAAIRDVILSPVPAALAIPLGLDVSRAALSLAKSVLDKTKSTLEVPRSLPFAQAAELVPALGPLFLRVRAAVEPGLELAAALVKDAQGEEDPNAFSLLEVLRRLLARDR
jgi:hypothetical protein